MRRQAVFAVVLTQAQPAERGFQRAGRAKGMTGHGLGRRTGHAGREQGRHRVAFHGVVVRGGGAMQVQVGDLLRLQPGPAQRLAHRLLGAAAGRFRRGYVVCIGTGATAQQGNRLAVARLFAH
ncbi:hypothetical protein D9M71_473010 [compost metagenome]